MQLPQNLKFRDAALSRAFAGKGRIPMSTFVERYIDGSIEVAGDLHDFLRARSEWANYRFTWDQAKFLFTRMTEPDSPNWDHRDPNWAPTDCGYWRNAADSNATQSP